MGSMFFNATNFNHPLDFNVSKVTNMGGMFNNASSFNQDISSWDVENVTNWSEIFTNCPIQTDYKPEKFR
jgi:surface protein